MTAIATKNLIAQDDTVEFPLPEEWNGGVAIWLAAGAVGTVILEFGSPQSDLTAPFAPKNEWVQVEMKNPAIAVNDDVDNLVGASGAQYGWAECVGVNRIRARRTDAAGSDCYASLLFRRT
jgi:hypothetical protein